MGASNYRDVENDRKIMARRGSFAFFTFFYVWWRAHNQDTIIIESDSYIEKIQGECLLYRSINYNHVGQQPVMEIILLFV